MFDSTHSLSHSLVFRQQKLHLSRQRTAPWQWVFGTLSTMACLTSAYLAWVAVTAGSVAGCGSGQVFDCSHVLTSRWSSFFGLPVSIFAVALHLSVMTLLIVPVKNRIRWPLISFAALSAGIGGLWFVGLQVFLLEHLCPYCMVVHSCGLAMAMLAIWNAPLSASTNSRLGFAAAFLVAVFATAQYLMPAEEKFEMVEHSPTSQSATGLEAGPAEFEANAIQPLDQAAGQGDVFESPLDTTTDHQSFNMMMPFAFSPVSWLTAQVTAGTPSTPTPTDNRKFATVLGDVRLDVTSWPLLGKPDAEVVIVEMLDYTCGHCQNTHAAIAGAMERFQDRLAVIVLPVPMDSACNPQISATSGAHREACKLAKLAIAVWHIKPAAFTEFHHWLMQSKPNYSQAFVRAEQTVGNEPLRNELASGLPEKFIAQNIKLYQRANSGAIPKVLFPTSTAVGELRSTDTLLSIIDKQLGQRP